MRKRSGFIRIWFGPKQNAKPWIKGQERPVNFLGESTLKHHRFNTHQVHRRSIKFAND